MEACRREADALPPDSDRAKAMRAYADKLEAALGQPESKRIAAIVEVVMEVGQRSTSKM
jgi:hypothetical protein